jgi:hypothetical protein
MGGGYVHANLARHCFGCRDRGVDEVTTPLLDFRWTVHQLASCAFLIFSYDLEIMRRAICSQSRGDGVTKAGMSTALNLISGAVQCGGQALNNYMELAFVIHVRLFVRLSEMAGGRHLCVKRGDACRAPLVLFHQMVSRAATRSSRNVAYRWKFSVVHDAPPKMRAQQSSWRRMPRGCRHGSWMHSAVV